MNAPKFQSFAISSSETLRVETVADKVNLSFFVMGLKLSEKKIPAEVSQAIGAALTLHGKEAAAREAGNA